jgi:hypothetical protein
MPSGYSGTPLAKKLGIKPGARVLLLEAPPEYLDWLGDLPDDVEFAKTLTPDVTIVHVFAIRAAKLRLHLERLRKSIAPATAIWVSWPKKASKVPTDITEDVIRDIALPLGLVDVKVCAVTEVWSGLRLVIRKSER